MPRQAAGYVVCDFPEDSVDAASLPGAAVGVEVCVRVELGVGLVGDGHPE